MGKRSGAYRVLVGTSEGRRPRGRPRCRWEYNIRTDCKETGWKGVDWVDQAYDRDSWWAVANSVITFLLP
jgi:hypothetical protein